uniref:Uncharacterized protein n=1 Tax=Ixodes ricinus TaxID=34613 RepID=A0A6B0UQ77_IXORI
MLFYSQTVTFPIMLSTSAAASFCLIPQRSFRQYPTLPGDTSYKNAEGKETGLGGNYFFGFIRGAAINIHPSNLFVTCRTTFIIQHVTFQSKQPRVEIVCPIMAVVTQSTCSTKLDFCFFGHING